MAEVQFLFDNQLIAGVESLIKEAKNKLLLISPFIDLDRRIQDALLDKKSKHDFELKVLFGKNEENIYKSIKKNSIDFFKQFPNIEIRYSDRLHAKFFLNDFSYIITSLNLYDYSLANNIEVGVIGSYATKGFIGKVIDAPDALINQGVDKVKTDFLGLNKDVNPIEKFQTIFENSELKYKTEPIIINSGGVRGAFGSKKLDGYNVIIDKLDYNKKSEASTNDSQQTNFNSNQKTLSLSQISKNLGIPATNITEAMQKSGLISGDIITELGKSKGLTIKSYMGRDYIAYPENLTELNDLKK